ncbi:MAG TPA: helix-turn-helix domain-containing protein, partial [Limnochordia bacterium]
MSKIRMRQARVPLALLLAPELTPCAKLVWIMLRLDAQAAHGKAAQGRSISPTALARRIGIARSTVYTAFYQLVHAGWASAARGAPRASSARIEP